MVLSVSCLSPGLTRRDTSSKGHLFLGQGPTGCTCKGLQILTAFYGTQVHLTSRLDLYCFIGTLGFHQSPSFLLRQCRQRYTPKSLVSISSNHFDYPVCLSLSLCFFPCFFFFSRNHTVTVPFTLGYYETNPLEPSTHASNISKLHSLSYSRRNNFTITLHYYSARGATLSTTEGSLNGNLLLGHTPIKNHPTALPSASLQTSDIPNSRTSTPTT